MTGDTAKGRSISVISALLPRKSNFAIAQAAAMPKIMLSGTVIAATNSVSCTAASASGSETAAKYAPKPLESASTNTMISGSTRNIARNTSASAISSNLPSRELIGHHGAQGPSPAAR
jgi:hypothetical protein